VEEKEKNCDSFHSLFLVIQRNFLFFLVPAYGLHIAILMLFCIFLYQNVGDKIATAAMDLSVLEASPTERLSYSNLVLPQLPDVELQQLIGSEAVTIEHSGVADEIPCPNCSLYLPARRNLQVVCPRCNSLVQAAAS